MTEPAAAHSGVGKDRYTGRPFIDSGHALSKQIPLMALMMLPGETQSNRIHVCGLMLFEKPTGRRGLVPILFS